MQFLKAAALAGAVFVVAAPALAQKSKDYAAGAAPSVEWNAEDRAAAKEEEVKQRTGGNNR